MLTLMPMMKTEKTSDPQNLLQQAMRLMEVAQATTGEAHAALLEIASNLMQTANSALTARTHALPTGFARCPHCKETMPIKTQFGYRTLRNGIIKAQSWCRSCRASPDSHPGRG